MKQHNLHFLVILTALAGMMLVGCKGSNSENNGSNATADSLCTESMETGLSSSEDTTAYDTIATSNTDPNPLPEEVTEKPKESAAASNSKPAAKKENLYISTHGAQGEVWGHVTMQGNTGKGTIHDQDENTLSITVTRHGKELYGVDQNGRQYVFKL